MSAQPAGREAMHWQVEPVGWVRSSRRQVEDDNWGGLLSEIVVTLGEDSLRGIEDFSHAEIIFLLDRAEPAGVVTDARRPRGNPAWPLAGIFAQRAKDRPNRLGLTIVKIIKRNGNVLTVEGLDAVDGTPVLDIKPVMREFLPSGPIRQPQWATELMKDYWSQSGTP